MEVGHRPPPRRVHHALAWWWLAGLLTESSAAVVAKRPAILVDLQPGLHRLAASRSAAFEWHGGEVVELVGEVWVLNLGGQSLEMRIWVRTGELRMKRRTLEASELWRWTASDLHRVVWPTRGPGAMRVDVPGLEYEHLGGPEAWRCAVEIVLRRVEDWEQRALQCGRARALSPTITWALLQSRAVAVRCEAIDGMPGSTLPLARDLLRECLESGSPRERALAALALARAGDREVWPLIQGLQSDTDPGIAARANLGGRWLQGDRGGGSLLPELPDSERRDSGAGGEPSLPALLAELRKLEHLVLRALGGDDPTLDEGAWVVASFVPTHRVVEAALALMDIECRAKSARSWLCAQFRRAGWKSSGGERFRAHWATIRSAWIPGRLPW